MPGDIKSKYAASSTPTVTNLQSLAASADWTVGWVSASVTNTSNCYDDYLYGFKFTTHASNRQAGIINVYVIASLNDTPTWPSSASGTIGTEGTLSFTDTEERDAVCRLLLSIPIDNTASAVFESGQAGIAALFGGRVPTHHALFIAQNAATSTNAGLASSGNAVYYTPVYSQYT
jgi:hypothetical protein